MSLRKRRANSGVKLICIGGRSGCSWFRAIITLCLGVSCISFAFRVVREFGVLFAAILTSGTIQGKQIRDGWSRSQRTDGSRCAEADVSAYFWWSELL